MFLVFDLGVFWFFGLGVGFGLFVMLLSCVIVCEDGELFQKAIEETIATGEPRTVKAKSIGTNKAGEKVAEFYITWSFKSKFKK